MKVTRLFFGLSIYLAAVIANANTAVSGVNGKLSSAYTNTDSKKGSVVSGSISLPFAESLGFQFDGLYTETDGEDAYGVGGHFFWRKSDKGLVGFTSGALLNNDIDSYEFSLESEYYFQQWTIGAKTGWASIEYDKTVVFADTDKDGVAGKLYATFYPIDNLSATASIQHRFDNNYANLELEYALPLKSLSITASVIQGEHDFDGTSIGIRYYFGGNKSLKQRHRSDDPQNVIHDIRNGVNSYQAEYRKQQKKYQKEQERYLERLYAYLSSYRTGLIARESIKFTGSGVSFDSYDSNGTSPGDYETVYLPNADIFPPNAGISPPTGPTNLFPIVGDP